MDTLQLRVYNLTRNSYVSLRAASVDSSDMSLDELLLQICEETDRSLWMKPYHRFDLPFDPSKFDFLYLDQNNEVIEAPRSHPAFPSEEISAQIASLLVLPGNSIKLSETHAGDQLVIGPPGEMKRYLGLFCRPQSYHPAREALPPLAQPLNRPGISDSALQSSRESEILDPFASIPKKPAEQSGHAIARAELRPVAAKLRTYKLQFATEFKATERKAPVEIDVPSITSPPETQIPEALAEPKRMHLRIPDLQLRKVWDSIWSLISRFPLKANLLRWRLALLRRLSRFSLSNWPAQAVRRTATKVLKTRPARSRTSATGLLPIISITDYTALAASGFMMLMRNFVAISREIRSSTRNAWLWMSRLSVPNVKPRVKLTRPSPAAPACVTRVRYSRRMQAVDEPHDRRRGNRRHGPGLAAFFTNGGAPLSYEVGDVSVTGFYMLTPERWMPGTMLRLILQRNGTNGMHAGDYISVWWKVVRSDLAGVGGEFVLSNPETHARYGNLPGGVVHRIDIEHFLLTSYAGSASLFRAAAAK